MKKRPFLMALLTLGAIFLFFLVLVVLVSHFDGKRSFLASGDRVGVVKISGVISSSGDINRQIIELRRDASIKAIVLRINSPGGSVGPAQEIYEEVKKAAAVKPVIVSMGAVAASGGYYVAAPAKRIFADPGTITGSIGVIMEFTNIQDLLGKIGLKRLVVESGPHKDIGSPARPMTPSDRRILQSVIDDTYQQFVQAVADGRRMDVQKVRELADGRIFTGRQAQKLGLVDQLGNLQDAIMAAAGMAGIRGEPQVVYPRRRGHGLLDDLIDRASAQISQGLQSQAALGLKFLWSGVH